MRGLRRQHADESVQRNMLTAFDAFMRSLNELHAAKSAAAPHDFSERIHFWHVECGLPEATRAALQKLRVWRNAAARYTSSRSGSTNTHTNANANTHTHTNTQTGVK